MTELEKVELKKVEVSKGDKHLSTTRTTQISNDL